MVGSVAAFDIQNTVSESDGHTGQGGWKWMVGSVAAAFGRTALVPASHASIF